MEPQEILEGLVFVGEVPARRQTYYVYEGPRHYVVMSVSLSKENSFNFNLVPKEAAEFVRRSFGGRKRLTSSDVARESRKPVFIRKSLDALNILYALCASGLASIDQRYRDQRSIYFNVRKG